MHRTYSQLKNWLKYDKNSYILENKHYIQALKGAIQESCDAQVSQNIALRHNGLGGAGGRGDFHTIMHLAVAVDRDCSRTKFSFNLLT